jgi:hypothetical protein
VVARPDRHLHAGRLPPVDAVADREHDPVLGRRLVRARRHDKARAAHAVGLELLDDHSIEQRAQVMTGHFP